MKKKKINEQKSTVQEILATEMSCGIIRFAANVVEDIFKKKDEVGKYKQALVKQISKYT